MAAPVDHLARGALADADVRLEPVCEVASLRDDGAHDGPLGFAHYQVVNLVELIGGHELQQLKADLAQVKQELQQLKAIPSALASLRQSVDQLAGSQQQIAGTIAKLGTQKPASPPRPAPAPAPKPLTPPQSEVR